jgi:hypothetical protein
MHFAQRSGETALELMFRYQCCLASLVQKSKSLSSFRQSFQVLGHAHSQQITKHQFKLKLPNVIRQSFGKIVCDHQKRERPKSHVWIMRLLQISSLSPCPSSMVAIDLQHENVNDVD